jgi:acyl dehydratase
MAINYGSNKVRFTSPVPAGSHVRNRMKLLEVSDVSGGWQVRWQVTVEIEGKDKPACVAEVISRLYEAQK